MTASLLTGQFRSLCTLFDILYSSLSFFLPSFYVFKHFFVSFRLFHFITCPDLNFILFFPSSKFLWEFCPFLYVPLSFIFICSLLSTFLSIWRNHLFPLFQFHSLSLDVHWYFFFYFPSSATSFADHFSTGFCTIFQKKFISWTKASVPERLSRARPSSSACHWPAWRTTCPLGWKFSQQWIRRIPSSRM
jgi:hypothetical protein